MADGYRLTYADVRACLFDIFEQNIRFCKHSVDYGVAPNIDDGFTVADTLSPVGSKLYEPIKVRVGVKTLKSNMLPDGRVRDEDAIMAIFKGFHESAHLWEYTVAYVRNGPSLPEGIRDMARTYVIGSYFTEYRPRL